MDKISIIMPIYNAEKTLNKAILSVLNQSYKNFELILVNDGSFDSSKTICEQFQKNDTRIIFIDKDNSGPSATRNLGLEKSTGEYITFIDSDDSYDVNYLEVLLNNIKVNLCDWTCCDYSIIINKQIVENKTLENFSTNSKIEYLEKLDSKKKFAVIWNKLYKTSIIKENNIIFDTTLEMAEDYLFNINYLMKCEKFSYLNKKLYNYEIPSNSLTSKYRKDDFERRIKINNTLSIIFDENNIKSDYLNKRYLNTVLRSISSVLCDKRCKLKFREKIEVIIGYVNNKFVCENIKNINCNSFYQKIGLHLIKNKKCYLLYYFVKIKEMIKGMVR